MSPDSFCKDNTANDVTFESLDSLLAGKGGGVLTLGVHRRRDESEDNDDDGGTHGGKSA